MTNPFDQFDPAANPFDAFDAAKPTAGQAAMRGLGLGVRDVAEGLASSLPGMAIDAATWPGRAVNRLLGIPTTAPSDMVSQGLTAAGVAEPETAGERMRSAAIRPVAAALGNYGAGAIPQVAAMAPSVSEALTTALPAQMTGAATGGVAGQAAAERGVGPVGQAAASIGGAVVGAALPAAAGRVISPVRSSLTPEAQRLVNVAEAEGIPLSAGQRTGSRPLRTLESTLAQLPGSSGREVRAIEDQLRQFNAAVLKRSGTDAQVATPEVLTAARSRIGGVIGEIAERNNLAFTPDFQQTLADFENELRFVPSEIAKPLAARIEQLRGMTVNDNGATIIPGSAYRMLDSALGKSIRDSSTGDFKSKMGDLRGLVRAAMDASISPEDAATWAEARRQYANLMVAKDAASGAGSNAAEGNISPLGLRSALDRSTGKGYGWGQGDLNDLARIGQQVLRPLPDSFTAQRNFMIRALTGSPVLGGTVGGAVGGLEGAAAGLAMTAGAPAVIGAAMRTKAGQAWLTNQLGANLTTSRAAEVLAALDAEQARNRLGPARR